MSTTSDALLGRYLLLRRIGKGGMAEVFRALSFGAKGFRRLVAIKRILPAYSDDPQFENMFINEATIASHLNHSNIVPINDFGRVDKRLYATMDYVHGVSLMDLLSALSKQQMPPPIEAACYILRKALCGLEQAHRQLDAQGHPLNIIHRDLSPANILLSFDGEVRIADFSIAKATPSEVFSSQGVLKGKLRYMSPEQARGEKLDQRSDLFSLGACFYELLTLRRLYPAKGPMQVAKQVRNAEFVQPREHNPLISQTLEAMLLKTLRFDREQRMPNAQSWRENLEHFCTQSRLGFYRSDLSELLGRLFAEHQAQMQKEMQEEMRAAASLNFAPMEEASLKLTRPSPVDLPLREGRELPLKGGAKTPAPAKMPVTRWRVKPLPNREPLHAQEPLPDLDPEVNLPTVERPALSMLEGLGGPLPVIDDPPELPTLEERPPPGVPEFTKQEDVISFSVLSTVDEMDDESTNREMARPDHDTDPPSLEQDTVLNVPLPKLPPRKKPKKR